MRVMDSRWGVVCAYVATVCALFLITAQLSSHVAGQAVILAAEYFPERAAGPRPPSRVEQQIAAALAFQPAEPDARLDAAVLTAPALPARLLAEQLDLAEAADIGGAKTPRQRRARRAPPVALSAGEEFGRRFGVMTVAAR